MHNSTYSNSLSYIREHFASICSISTPQYQLVVAGKKRKETKKARQVPQKNDLKFIEAIKQNYTGILPDMTFWIKFSKLRINYTRISF